MLFELFTDADHGTRGTGADDEQSDSKQEENETALCSLLLAGESMCILFHGVPPFFENGFIIIVGQVEMQILPECWHVWM